MSVDPVLDTYCVPCSDCHTNSVRAARNRRQKGSYTLGSWTPFAVIDNGVFPVHSLVTVLLESGKETIIQPTTTR